MKTAAEYFLSKRGDETQADFGRQCGMSESWVRNTEHGRTGRPPATTMKELARCLGVPLAELRALKWPSPPKVHKLTIPTKLWESLESRAAAAGLTVQAYAFSLLAEHRRPRRVLGTSPTGVTAGGKAIAESQPDRAGTTRKL